MQHDTAIFFDILVLCLASGGTICEQGNIEDKETCESIECCYWDTAAHNCLAVNASQPCGTNGKLH